MAQGIISYRVVTDNEIRVVDSVFKRSNGIIVIGEDGKPVFIGKDKVVAILLTSENDVTSSYFGYDHSDDDE